jgi:hypothetical protein
MDPFGADADAFFEQEIEGDVGFVPERAGADARLSLPP